jgi:hypothetical protein
MKKVFYLMLTLMVLGAASVKSQVRIGGTADPHPTVLLDLNPTDTTNYGKLGLALPRVSLASTTAQLNSATPANGVLVYNTNASMTEGQGAGVYFWNGNNWQAVVVAITKKVTALTITPATASVAVSNNLPLVATITPADATNQTLIWSSSNPAIATVDAATGIVRGVVAGTATITARTMDGSNVSGTKSVTVYAGAGTVTFGSNTYRTYTYPGTIGTWMVQNSKEGKVVAQNAGWERYYYRDSTKTTACPSGWALPTIAQLTQMFEYLINSATQSEYNDWLDPYCMTGVCYAGTWTPSETIISGGYHSSDPRLEVQCELGNRKPYWTGGPSVNAFGLVVRCRKN